MNNIEFGDCRTTMRRWKQQGIKAQTCVTSPPYYGLRDYGTAKWEGGENDCEHIESENKHGGQRADRNQEGYKKQYKDLCIKCGATRIDSQIGLEETPEQYIDAMVEVFRCVWDVLEDDGTLWLNLGDSYGVVGGNTYAGFNERWSGTGGAGSKQDATLAGVTDRKINTGLKPKNLLGIPWRVALALQADGWTLRQDIIWHKPNPMPESVQDRCTKAHEYIFLLSKSQKYYYDHESIKDPVKQNWGTRDRSDGKYHNEGTGLQPHSGLEKSYEMANKRSVWTVNTKPYAGAHFAVFPSDLIEPCILAGAPAGGIVLDPFMGSGTTAQVAQHLGRKYLGCELNIDYKPLQDNRLAQQSLILG